MYIGHHLIYLYKRLESTRDFDEHMVHCFRITYCEKNLKGASSEFLKVELEMHLLVIVANRLPWHFHVATLQVRFIFSKVVLLGCEISHFRMLNAGTLSIYQTHVSKMQQIVEEECGGIDFQRKNVFFSVCNCVAAPAQFSNPKRNVYIYEYIYMISFKKGCLSS